MPWNLGQTKEYQANYFFCYLGKKNPHVTIIIIFLEWSFLYVLFKMLMECICNSDNLSLNHCSPE